MTETEIWFCIVCYDVVIIGDKKERSVLNM